MLQLRPRPDGKGDNRECLKFTHASPGPFPGDKPVRRFDGRITDATLARMDGKPEKPLPFQFGLGSLFSAILAIALLLSAWRIEPVLVLLAVAVVLGLVLGAVLAMQSGPR